MNVQLNVVPTDKDGAPVPSPIVTLYIIDALNHECPMEPRIRQQGNFYNGEGSYGAAIGPDFHGPFQVYGTVVAAGMNTAYFGPLPWDGSVTLNIPVPLSFKRPFRAMPPFWKANMCGIRVPGLPDVPGGAPGNPDLFLSWFYHLYGASDQARARDAYRGRGLTHWLTSWPDAQDAGLSPGEFAGSNGELIDGNFFPCAMLSAKPTSSANVRTVRQTLDNIMLVLPDLIAAKVPAVCLGWELSLWLTPEDVQWLIDQLSGLILPHGIRFYVHFQEGYMSFQVAGGTIADFYHANVGKIDGVLYQKRLDQDDAQFLDSISDCLQRICGGFNMPSQSGVHEGPFWFTALELDAMKQYNNNEPESEGIRLGQLAINAPHCFGPDGTEAFVQGAGNG